MTHQHITALPSAKRLKFTQDSRQTSITGQRARVPGHTSIDSAQPVIRAAAQGDVRGFQHHQVPGVAEVIRQLRAVDGQQCGARLLQRLLSTVRSAAAVMDLVRERFEEVGHASVFPRGRRHAAPLARSGAVPSYEVMDFRLLPKPSGIPQRGSAQLRVGESGELIFHRGDRTDRRLKS